MSEPQFPISELVSQNIATVLGKLTSDTSGYNTVLTSVERAKRNPPPTPAHLKAVIWPPQKEAADGAIGLSTWWAHYQVTVYYFDPDGEATTVSFEQATNGIAADVEKVLLSEINTTFFGDYVQDLFPTGVDLDIDSNEPASVSIYFKVMYRTNQFDPYVMG